jgi:hypothetical protein
MQARGRNVIQFAFRVCPSLLRDSPTHLCLRDAANFGTGRPDPPYNTTLYAGVLAFSRTSGNFHGKRKVLVELSGNWVLHFQISGAHAPYVVDSTWAPLSWNL